MPETGRRQQHCSPVFCPWLLFLTFSPWLLSSLISMVTPQSSLHGYCSPIFSPRLLLSNLLSVVALQSSLHGYCLVYSPWSMPSLLSMVTLQSSLHGNCPVFSPWLLLSCLLSVVTVQSSLHGYSPVFSPWLLSGLLSLDTLQSSLCIFLSPVFGICRCFPVFSVLLLLSKTTDFCSSSGHSTNCQRNGTTDSTRKAKTVGTSVHQQPKVLQHRL